MDERRPVRKKRMLLVATAALTSGIAPASCGQVLPITSGFYECTDASSCGVVEQDAPFTGFVGQYDSAVVDAPFDDADVADGGDADIDDADAGNSDP